jgi:hypothetical protein
MLAPLALAAGASICRTLGLSGESAGLGLRLTDLVSSPQAESITTAARAVARTGEPAVWRGVNQLPGESRDHAVEVNLSPVTDPAGQVRAVLVVAFDMTEQYLARQRLALLNEVSTRIGSTLDMTRTAEELVEVAVPRLADFATVDLLESVFRGEEPAPEPFEYTVPFRRLACGSILDGTPEALVRPGQVSAIPGYSPSVGRLTRGVPIRARGTTLGIALFVRHQRPEPFQDDDLVLAEEIVARAAVCIDNARRYSREHATALALQRSLLPRHLPAQAAVQVATRYLPAGSASPSGVTGST